MKKIAAVVVLACCLLAVSTRVHAQGLVITQFRPQEINLQVPNGDGLVLSTPDLTPVAITIGYDTRFFDVSSGDFLSEDTIDSFTLFDTNGTSNPTLSFSSLPLGTSLIGFSAFDVFGPSKTFGWAQLLRTSETLTVVASDSVFSATPSDSFGTFVPASIPEPTSMLFLAYGLTALMLPRRRSR